MSEDRKRFQTFNQGESMTQRQFRDDCNIKEIIRRSMKAGRLPEPTKIPQYGDFSNIANFREIQQTMVEAQQNFMQLPAKIRHRFQNDPANLVDFLQDEKNRSEAESLGLIEKKASESEPPTSNLLDVTGRTDTKQGEGV